MNNFREMFSSGDCKSLNLLWRVALKGSIPSSLIYTSVAQLVEQLSKIRPC